MSLLRDAFPMPESFKCPISGDVFQSPVRTVDGHVYERASIEEWFRRGQRTSPLTNERLPSLELTEDWALKGAVEEYLKLRPEIVRQKEELELLRKQTSARSDAYLAVRLRSCAQQLEEACTFPEPALRDIAARLARELAAMAGAEGSSAVAWRQQQQEQANTEVAIKQVNESGTTDRGDDEGLSVSTDAPSAKAMPHTAAVDDADTELVAADEGEGHDSLVELVALMW